MNASRTTLALTGLLGLFVSLLAAGCGQKAPAVTPPVGKEQPTLQTAQPHRQTIKRFVEQPAHVEAYEETPVFVKIPGYVEKVYIEAAGQEVKKGDLLAELYVPELREELKYKTGFVAQAKIDITLAERALEVSHANTKTAESLVEEAKFSLKRTEAMLSRWQSESLRMEQLVRDKVVDTQSRDETLSQYRSAIAARDEADAKHRSAEALLIESIARGNKAKTEIAAAQNRLELAKADEARTAALLSYARIPSPLDGIVSFRDPKISGRFAQPPSGSNAQPLFIVYRRDKVRVFVDVPERDAEFIKYDQSDKKDPNLGSVARIRIPDRGDKEYVGKVTGSSGSLDPNQRTLRTEIDFDSDGLLRPGEYAQAIIEVEEPNAWMAPIAAVLTRDAQTFAFLLHNGKAVKTLVKIGSRDGDSIQILKKQIAPAQPGMRAAWVDLTGNESFIVENVNELSDGQEVHDSNVSAGKH